MRARPLPIRCTHTSSTSNTETVSYTHLDVYKRQVLGAGFVYSMSAPGNTVRAGMIGYSCSPVKAIARSLYEGAILMTGYVRFPLLGLTLSLIHI